jgi:hypothetical protein
MKKTRSEKSRDTVPLNTGYSSGPLQHEACTEVSPFLYIFTTFLNTGHRPGPFQHEVCTEVSPFFYIFTAFLNTGHRSGHRSA